MQIGTQEQIAHAVTTIEFSPTRWESSSTEVAVVADMVVRMLPPFPRLRSLLCAYLILQPQHLCTIPGMTNFIPPIVTYLTTSTITLMKSSPRPGRETLPTCWELSYPSLSPTLVLVHTPRPSPHPQSRTTGRLPESDACRPRKP